MYSNLPVKNYNSGTYRQNGSYKCFLPERINRDWAITDMALIKLLTEAERAIGQLDMYSSHIPNIDLFISMHIAKEANKSSKIEGTKTNMKEIFLQESEMVSEKRDDWLEVQNYIDALNYAINDLKNIPFSTRLIKGAHKILLQGARGKHKLPGEYRSSQNWIGGSSINDATFIPPSHNDIHELMNDLEHFVHNERILLPDLLKVALMHSQFETIHPFLDGNGRVGRLLITLFLVDKEILNKPILYLSDFFERNRLLYYDKLTLIREKNDLLGWFKFFLVGVKETAESSISTIRKILALKEETERKVQKLGSRSVNAQKITNALFKNPAIRVSEVMEITGLKTTASYKLINDLEREGIIENITGEQRNKIYVFIEYLNLFS